MILGHLNTAVQPTLQQLATTQPFLAPATLDLASLSSNSTVAPYSDKADLMGNYPHVHFEQPSPNVKIFKGNYMTSDPVYGLRPMTPEEQKEMDDWAATFMKDMSGFEKRMENFGKSINNLRMDVDDIQDQLEDELDGMSDILSDWSDNDDWVSDLDGKMAKFQEDMNKYQSQLKKSKFAKLTKKQQKLMKKKQKTLYKIEMKHKKAVKKHNEKLKKKLAKMQKKHQKKIAKMEKQHQKKIAKIVGKRQDKPKGKLTDMEGTVFGNLNLGKGTTNVHSPTDLLVTGNISNDQDGAVVNVGLLI